MINVKILELLDKDERNISWLSRRTGLSYSALHKLSSNNTNSISFDTLEAICTALECNIEDVLEIVKSE
ncbi:helix-turn-helix domain-containing protein [Tissierella pigra]|uniref:Helix-turn-helix transcriptional regulator n=1 Tax=Tissierella pigra TaxID=2607614 RepID=A0A6N7XY12_9FIRM|nr:helix-turn-helix transcriptional regulator [Tissierella pigra]MSU01375.1 helix-turn-helix transcriptional regulator [Tissierella pigra]